MVSFISSILGNVSPTWRSCLGLSLQGATNLRGGAHHNFKIPDRHGGQVPAHVEVELEGILEADRRVGEQAVPPSQEGGEGTQLRRQLVDGDVTGQRAPSARADDHWVEVKLRVEMEEAAEQIQNNWEQKYYFTKDQEKEGIKHN